MGIWGKLILRFYGAVLILGAVIVTLAVVIGGFLPGGGQVAFMSDIRNPGTCEWQFFSECDLYILDVQRKIIHPLTLDEGSERYPAWSPDGEQIAYHADQPVTLEPANDFNSPMQTTPQPNPLISDFDLYMMDADGRNAGPLDFGFDDPRYDEAMMTWGPNGKRVIYHAGISQAGDDFKLYVAEVNSTEFEPILDIDGDAIFADWSPDGRYIVFWGNYYSLQRNRQVNGLMVLPTGPNLDNPLANERLAQVIVESPDDFSTRFYFPTWSPDSSQVAYVLQDSGQTSDYNIYVVDAEGRTDPVNLTNTIGVINTHPEWLPDGRIMFASNRGGDFDLYVMDADGSNVERLIELPGNEQAPDWRPEPN